MKEDETTIYTPYRDDTIDIEKVNFFTFWWHYFRITSWQHIAHHPTCSRYNNHIFRIGKLTLCVGCTGLYSAILLHFCTYLFFRTFYLSILFINALFIPFAILSALSHHFLNPTNKWIKFGSRFILGLGVGSYLFFLLKVDSIIIRIFMIFLLFGSVFFYGELRKGASFKECPRCPMRRANPPCFPMDNTSSKLQKLINLRNKNKEKNEGETDTF